MVPPRAAVARRSWSCYTTGSFGQKRTWGASLSGPMGGTKHANSVPVVAVNEYTVYIIRWYYDILCIVITKKNMLPIDPKFNEIWWFQWGCMNCWKPSEAILVHFRGYGSHFWAYHVDHTQTAGFCCAWAVEGWDALGEFCHAGSGDRNCWWTCLSRDIHAQDCTSTYSTIINS